MLLVFSLCIPPAGVADENKPYLAVFASPGFSVPWVAMKPDLYIEADDWRSLDDFIDLVEVSTDPDQTIILDVDSHGDDETNNLVLDGADTFSRASFGYVINKLNRLHKTHKNLVVISEACFAGDVYNRSIKGYKKTYHSKYLQIENSKNPKYPVYGAYNLFNWGNYSYLQYKSGQKTELYDLRKLKYKKPDTDKTSKDNQAVRSSFLELYVRMKSPSLL